MPKTLVLHGADDALATALAEGARAVRFAEVDVRPFDATLPSLAHYDAIALDASIPDFALLLVALGGRPDIVGATFGGTDAARWAVLRAMGEVGMILVPPAEAGALGRRVATVAEWVRHAKSHHH